MKKKIEKINRKDKIIKISTNKSQIDNIISSNTLSFFNIIFLQETLFLFIIIINKNIFILFTFTFITRYLFL